MRVLCDNIGDIIIVHWKITRLRLYYTSLYFPPGGHTRRTPHLNLDCINVH